MRKQKALAMSFRSALRAKAKPRYNTIADAGWSYACGTRITLE